MVLLPGCSCCPPCVRLGSELWDAASVELDVTAQDRLTHRQRTWIKNRCGKSIGETVGLTDWFPGSHYAGRISLTAVGTGNYFVFGEQIFTKTFAFEYPGGVDGCCDTLQQSTANPNGRPFVSVVVERRGDLTLYGVRFFCQLTAAGRCNTDSETYLNKVTCSVISEGCPGITQSPYVGAAANVLFECSSTTGLPSLSSTVSVGLANFCNAPSDESGGSLGTPAVVMQTGSGSVTFGNVEFLA